MVDSGSEATWLPEADLRSAGIEVFKRDQLKRLGARTLEGFNAVVDTKKKKLIAAGPMPAA
jgi:hypothetical protein